MYIDPALSSVTVSSAGFTVCDPSGQCLEPPAPRTFVLSGSFELEQFSGWDGERVRFLEPAVDSGEAAALGFTFPRYSARLLGGEFAGSEAECYSGPGQIAGCFSTGYDARAWGTFDGRSLAMNGIDFERPDFYAARFEYTLVARSSTASSLPEPGTFASLGLGVLVLARFRRTRR